MEQLVTLYPTDSLYQEVEREWLEAFPENERRDLDAQRSELANNTLLQAYVWMEEEEWKGAVTCWQLKDCLYIEHLFIRPQWKGQGLGTAILCTISERFQRPIVLEVELPTDEISKKRIAFYEKNGFSMYPNRYMQPPYRKGDTPFELRLMTNGELNKLLFEQVRAELYQKVYYFFE